MAKEWLAFVLSGLFATTSVAMLDTHNPFPEGRKPAPISLTRYLKISQPFGPPVHFVRPDRSQSPLAISYQTDGFALQLDPHTGQARFYMSVFGSMLGDISAGEADLNNDGVQDYVVITYSGGNGLAAEACSVTFILSSAGGYVGRQVASYDANLDDLIDLKNDAHPEFVHQFFVSGVAGKDGLKHSYWVFNLLTFKETIIVDANPFDDRFPLWIWYSLRPNHKPTNKLDAKQREECWREALSPDHERWFGVDFGILRKLTSDQSRSSKATVP